MDNDIAPNEIFAISHLRSTQKAPSRRTKWESMRIAAAALAMALVGLQGSRAQLLENRARQPS